MFVEQGGRIVDAIAPLSLLREDLAHIVEPRARPTLNLLTCVMVGAVRLSEVRGIAGQWKREPALGKWGIEHPQSQAARWHA